MKTLKIMAPKPPNPIEAFGKFFVQPIRIFQEKGHIWSITLEWKIKRHAFELAPGVEPEIAMVCSWGDPEVKRENNGPVRLENGKLCPCEECVPGRKEVEAGWTPWGNLAK